MHKKDRAWNKHKSTSRASANQELQVCLVSAILHSFNQQLINNMQQEGSLMLVLCSLAGQWYFWINSCFKGGFHEYQKTQFS